MISLSWFVAFPFLEQVEAVPPKTTVEAAGATARVWVGRLRRCYGGAVVSANAPKVGLDWVIRTVCIDNVNRILANNRFRAARQGPPKRQSEF